MPVGQRWAPHAAASKWVPQPSGDYHINRGHTINTARAAPSALFRLTSPRGLSEVQSSLDFLDIRGWVLILI